MARALLLNRVQALVHRPSRPFQEALRSLVTQEGRVVEQALLQPLSLFPENAQVVGTVIKWIVEALTPSDLDSTLMERQGQTRIISPGAIQSLTDRLCRDNSPGTMSSSGQATQANLLLQVLKRYQDDLGDDRIGRVQRLSSTHQSFQWRSLQRFLASYSRRKESP
ncbi:hypothetical protein BJ684DRAFT_21325 [Piptocephalis cylindrospora]|uniref:Uncharacterized protein n=1 Tax=Piptocephalis cylindrospora TaxID=1907219 RepID=A0A4P9Y037_9FUNG|nr:hypothetical protein BJ684DRAFT_21325 [Piptocephalis cylindrospora]|eukprot:RKP12113.1 hypothetical protein BJ684DRAFT_21325 [Piptocephalis cylindrospora]